jgi:hypothetical protein
VGLKIVLSLRKEFRPMLKLVRIISGPRREEVSGSWRIIYNEELPTLYSSPIRTIRVINSRTTRQSMHGTDGNCIHNFSEET